VTAVTDGCTTEAKILHDWKMQHGRSANGILFMVKWTGKLVILVLAASLWATPLVACMLPDALLTEAERDCCSTMADQCGGTAMSESHSCCKMTVREIDPYLANSRFVPAHVQPAATLFDTADSVPSPETFTSMTLWAHTHSPPISPPATVAILRI